MLQVDVVMEMLQIELGSLVAGQSAPPTDGAAAKPPAGDVWSRLQYDSGSGERSVTQGSVVDDSSLDLSQGARVQLAHGNVAGTQGTVGPKTAQGHYTIDCDDGVRRVLGVWMMEAARDGRLDRLPVIQLQAATTGSA